MTALTFQQRRADFEEMLGRAVRVMDNTGRLQGNPEALGGSLARLADEVAGLESPPASPRSTCPAP